MAIGIRAEDWPARVATGLFILNSGVNKRGADRESAQGMQDMATTAYPFLGDLDAEQFADLLSKGELAVATALLAPVVPTWLAGVALTGFSSALLGLYMRTPGMRQQGNVRPTEQGTALAKDVWLVGIGVTLMLGGRRNRS